jgi:hypothetical protein
MQRAPRGTSGRRPNTRVERPATLAEVGLTA